MEKRIKLSGVQVEVGRFPIDAVLKDAAVEAAARHHMTLRAYVARAVELQLGSDGFEIEW